MESTQPMSDVEFQEFVSSERRKVATEIAFFEANRSTWQTKHLGKWVLVKGQEHLGFFDTFDDAHEFGVAKLGVTPMFIRQLGDPGSESLHLASTAFVFTEE